MMEKDFYLGRILTGRVSSGVVRVGDRVNGLRKTDSGSEKIEEAKVRLHIALYLEPCLQTLMSHLSRYKHLSHRL